MCTLEVALLAPSAAPLFVLGGRHTWRARCMHVLEPSTFWGSDGGALALAQGFIRAYCIMVAALLVLWVVGATDFLRTTLLL